MVLDGELVGLLALVVVAAASLLLYAMLDDCVSAVVCFAVVLRVVEAFVVAGSDEELVVSATKLFVSVSDFAVLVLSLIIDGVGVVFCVEVVGAAAVVSPFLGILWHNCCGPMPARNATTRFCP